MTMRDTNNTPDTEGKDTNQSAEISLNQRRVVGVRKKKPETAPRHHAVLAVLNFLLLITAVVLLGLISSKLKSAGWPNGAAPTDKTSTEIAAKAGFSRNELANKLKSVGLYPEAIEQYSRYIEEGNLSAKVRANIAYSIAQMLMEQGNHEKALSWLYQVELIDPETELKNEVGLKVVNCLERLNKLSAAEYALNARTSLDKDKAKETKGGDVLAEIGKDTLTLQQMNEALDDIPPYYRDQFKGKEKRLEFAKKFVADELLYRKALKMELNKDPAVQKQLTKITRELMLQKVVEDELKQRVKIDDSDIELYYKANKEKYVDKEKRQVGLIKTDSEEKAKEAAGKLAGGTKFGDVVAAYSMDDATKKKGGKVEQPITQDGVIPGIDRNEEAMSQIFALEADKYTEPLKIGEAYYIFTVESITPARQKEYDAVKEDVKREYTFQKQQQAYQEIMKSILDSTEVKFHPEVVENSPAEATPAQPPAADPGNAVQITPAAPAPK